MSGNVSQFKQDDGIKDLFCCTMIIGREVDQHPSVRQQVNCIRWGA